MVERRAQERVKYWHTFPFLFLRTQDPVESQTGKLFHLRSQHTVGEGMPTYTGSSQVSVGGGLLAYLEFQEWRPPAPQQGSNVDQSSNISEYFHITDGIFSACLLVACEV